MRLATPQKICCPIYEKVQCFVSFLGKKEEVEKIRIIKEIKKMTEKKVIKKSKISTGKVIAIGASVAALGAGAYYFLGPNGKKNQQKAKVWMTKMEKEVGGKMKKVKSATLPIYHKTVDTLAETYSKQYKEHAPEIKAFAKHLKSNWKGVEKKAKPVIKKAKKTIEKTINPIK